MMLDVTYVYKESRITKILEPSCIDSTCDKKYNEMTKRFLCFQFLGDIDIQSQISG